MAIDSRSVETDEEFRALLACDAVAFASEVHEEEVAATRAFLELDRTAAAFEGSRLVGSSGNLSMELTVPGLAVLPCAGLTYVGVMPSHRRRGLLTAMMGALLDDAVAHDEPLAALLASESIIYGRFGFGQATQAASYSLDRAHAATIGPLATTGTIRVLENDDAGHVLPVIQDRVRRTRAGGCTRSKGWWDFQLLDPAGRRGGRSRLFHAVHEPGGGEPADGYVTWRVEHRWQDNPEHVAWIRDVQAGTPDVHLALIDFVCHLDLVSQIRISGGPVDEPFRWVLADPRRLLTTAVNDMLWVRLLDVPRCLSARTYAAAGRIVLEVDDAFRPASGGRFVVEASGPGGACSVTTEAPDLAMSSADLSALYLGGVSPTVLAAAGRVRELTEGAVLRATMMFATERPPYGDTDF